MTEGKKALEKAQQGVPLKQVLKEAAAGSVRQGKAEALAVAKNALVDAATAVSQPNPLKESVAQGSDNAGQGRGRLKKSGDVLKITKNDKEPEKADSEEGRGRLRGHRRRLGRGRGFSCRGTDKGEGWPWGMGCSCRGTDKGEGGPWGRGCSCRLHRSVFNIVGPRVFVS